MKYVLLVPSGAADEPQDALEGKTPWQVARTPYLDDLASRGSVGRVALLPEFLAPTPEDALLALLGYDPLLWRTGAGGWEAVAFGVPLERRDIAFSCWLASSDGERLTGPATPIAADEMQALLGRLQQKLGSRRFTIVPGDSARCLLRWADGDRQTVTVDPEEGAGKRLQEILPRGEGADALRALIWDSLDLLDRHPVNERRRGDGKPPANLLWPHAPGYRIEPPPLWRERGVFGALVTASPSLRGIGLALGLSVPRVPGADGTVDSSFQAKVSAAWNEWDSGSDLVVVQVGAAADAARKGDLERKIAALERFDAELVGPLLDGFARRKQPFVLYLAPDAALPVARRRFVAGPVPGLRYDARSEAKNVVPLDERACEDPRFVVEEGFRWIEGLLPGSGGKGSRWG